MDPYTPLRTHVTLVARWLGSDKLVLQSQNHERQQALRNDEACGFLLAHHAFIEWYLSSSSQWLALVGDTGCGKTITMTFLVDELSRRNEHQLPQPKIAYYYCRDDQAGQAAHLFSTLILALLERLSGLKKTFFDWYKQQQASGILEPVASPRKLGEFLEMVLENLDRPFFVVIDGLDECDRASRKTLFALLTTLSQKAPRLKIALSSRPEEEILKQLGSANRIDLSSDARRDALIVRHTVAMQLSYLHEDIRALVIRTLSPLAQGSAIWTKMVIELIEVRKIGALGPMRLFLQQIPLPEQLSMVYTAMVSRHSSDDAENRELVTTALKILAAVWRPLSILELAWAVALATARQNVTTVAALCEAVDQVRLISLIHPFITRIDYSDVRKRQIGLVHQSVKEFITREWPRLQKSSMTTAPSRRQKYQQNVSLEAYILDVCMDYLLLDEIGSCRLFSEEQIAIEELPQECDLFDDVDLSEYDPHCTWEVWEENMIRYDPNERGFGQFFVYAASHWVTHFGAVQSGSLPDLAEIERLCHAGSTRLDNWINQNCRPDCAIKARFEFDSGLYDPLSITSLYGSEAMLRDMLENSDFDSVQFLASPLLNAAHQILQWGKLSRLKMLFLNAKSNYQVHNLEFFQLVIRQWSYSRWRHDDWNVAFELVDYALDTLVQERWGNRLFCIAARAGCMPMIHHLLVSAQQMTGLHTELLRGSEWMGEAVLGNHTEVVEFLLDWQDVEAHLGYVNSRGENLLHLASTNCNPAMFRLLVPHLHEKINETDKEGDTALMWIIKSHSNPKARYESARILLLSQPDVVWNSHYAQKQHDPLQLAVQLGDTDMCRLLVSDGKMNPYSALARGKDGQLVLKDRPKTNEGSILQLLRMRAACD